MHYMSIPVYSGIKRYFRNPPKPSKRVYGKGSRMPSYELPKQVYTGSYMVGACILHSTQRCALWYAQQLLVVIGIQL